MESNQCSTYLKHDNDFLHVQPKQKNVAFISYHCKTALNQSVL